MRTGTPRSPEDGERLARFDQLMQVPLVLAAVLPILLWLGGRRTNMGRRHRRGVVHVRLVERYRRSWRGRFDLGIVLLTGPWILLPVSSGLPVCGPPR